MKSIGERITLREDKNKSTVVIYPEKKAWLTALIGAWVAMWWVIGGVMTWSFFEFDLTRQEKLIIVIFMVFWAYYAYRVTKQFFWTLWGNEYLKMDNLGLTIKKSIKGYGKANVYFYENISEFKWEVPKERSVQASWEASPWVGGGQRLDFEYYKKKIRFGEKLSEKDARKLFQFMTHEMDRFIKESRRQEKKQQQAEINN